ncbi:MAG: nickel-dependent lactate racemase [Firmicutes bacterium]|nr:nickel-dependent lactate racemase [Bacillota bacterium]
MENIKLKYGKETLTIDIPKENLLGVIKAKFPKIKDNESEIFEMKKSLKNPIGTSKLSEIAKEEKRVAIMVSDITRPSPSKKILPLLLEELYKSGVKDKDITIIFGMGIHRSHTKEEQIKLVGKDIFNRIKCVDSNKEEYVYLGKTSRKTPIYLNKSLVEADIRICTGNIEYHYFAGYSGGAKAVMPGASNNKSIENNHKLQLSENSKSGKIINNPVREDIDEVGEILGIDFLFNVVLNEKKEVLKAFSGDYIKAHREGCKYLDSLYNIKIDEKADIVIVSPGGYPKDLNLYQTQKALDNASHAVRMGGTIILVSECSEGFGEDTFKSWIESSTSSKELIERLKKEFVLGGHKAAAIARVLEKAEIYFVSDMKKEDVEKIYFTPKESIQRALKDAMNKFENKSKVLIIPQGSSVLPVVK